MAARSEMDPATLTLVESVLRLTKGIVTALERWLETKKRAARVD